MYSRSVALGTRRCYRNKEVPCESMALFLIEAMRVNIIHGANRQPRNQCHEHFRPAADPGFSHLCCDKEFVPSGRPSPASARTCSRVRATPSPHTKVLVVRCSVLSAGPGEVSLLPWESSGARGYFSCGDSGRASWNSYVYWTRITVTRVFWPCIPAYLRNHVSQ